MALRLQSSSGGAERPSNSDSQDKIPAFSVVRKKTPFQKHREEEEAKKKRADEEAARLYEEFVESFKADDTPGSKAFVRGGVMNPNERVKATSEKERDKSSSESPVTRVPSSAKKPGSRYVPSFIPPGLAASVNKDKESDKKKDEEKAKEKDRGKSRNIDNFMEELKKEQEMREKRHQDREHRQRDGKPRGTSTPPSRFDELPEEDPNGKLPGSFDDGDPQTTNLYVGNLSPQVDENFLLRTFGRFGPIASVKIMWPRTEEERRRQRNCGFVAFMNRGEAQAAKDEMQGVVVYEYELRIGWGKAVALPAQALPAPPPGQMAIRSKEGGATADVAWSGPGAPSAVSVNTQNAEVVLTPNVPDIEVVPPSNSHLRHVIDTVAMYVLDDGCPFEQAIMERGRGNTLFNFLFDLGSPEHTYYVWRLYSFAQGDTLQRWRTEPFIMITGSGRWVPPPLPQQDAVRSPEHEKASTFAAGRVRRDTFERSLADAQRDEFEDMLRALTLERSQIRDAMGFALDNSEASGEVVDVLTESLTIKETPIPTKVARLMLVSDILHNSSAPVKNASAYRTNFEARLPDIMESFNDLYRNITGRITAEALKERVLKVLQVWADWFLFTDAYVNGLRVTFLRSGSSGVPGFHALCGDAPPAGLEDEQSMDEERVHEAALAVCQGEPAAELMSLPCAELERRCRHNGLCIRGGKGIMVARLLNLEESEKQKAGNGRNDLHKAARQRPVKRFDDDPADTRKKTILPASKWSKEDDGSEEEDRNDGRVGYSSGDEVFERRMDNDGRIDEERRQKLRRLEVSVMEYRDSLEERGSRNVEEIERKVMQHRKKLESDIGVEDSSRGSDRNERRDVFSRKRTRSRSRSRSPPMRGKDRSKERERGSKDRRERDRRARK
ncbi:protein RRC1 isoform X1 [Selaginella moellendorffii]|uniref:protein RRC1 isoform X1 n=1 Tax=Selaginella moellendorffii TaxID=88036 RepID=UPI000D1CE110|nr:protein RRC1 isoform X1 [Selaginella moellendorffii]|eukprot:XP_024543152.1 protein RRC1 isoform X1 [Selaginella moellendorffii]